MSRMTRVGPPPKKFSLRSSGPVNERNGHVGVSSRVQQKFVITDWFIGTLDESSVPDHAGATFGVFQWQWMQRLTHIGCHCKMTVMVAGVNQAVSRRCVCIVL